MTKKCYLTRKGLAEIEKELRDLKEKALPAAIELLRTAKEDDPDLVENVAYGNALREKEQVEQRIAELEEIVRNHELIKEGRKDVVSLGSTVTVEVGGEVDKFTIVGSLEADPAEGKISNESPVGRALLGAKPGSVVTATGSAVKATYKVLKIE